MPDECDTAFLLKRAEEEAVRAIQADETPAGEAHRELALRYSARAKEALSARSSRHVKLRAATV